MIGNKIIRNKIDDVSKFEFKFFGSFGMQKNLDDCLNEGYLPANLNTIRYLRKRDAISKGRFYTTITYLNNGKLADATVDELREMDEQYENEGGIRLISVDTENIGGKCVYETLRSDCINFVGYRLKKN